MKNQNSFQLITRQLIGRAFAIIFTAIGFVASVFKIIESDNKLIGMVIIAIVCLIALVYIIYNTINWYVKTPIGYALPPRYAIREARVNDLEEIVKLQQSFYPQDAVPFKIYNEWFNTNPDGFFVIQSTITNKDGQDSKEIVGHFTFLAIKDDCLALYKEGDIKETDIRHYNLIGVDDKATIKNIYIESVIIKKAHRRHAMFCLVRMLRTMIYNFCDPKTVENVYAMAATNDGKRTLIGMGFTMVRRVSGSERKDGHEMYECKFTKFFNEIIKRETKHEINMLHRDD